MRSLLKAEALVGRSLLAHPDEPQSAQIRATRVPRRTFQSTRQRILGRGWVQQRLVPDPRELGRPIAVLGLVQPYVEAMPRVVDAWRRCPGMVCLWTSGETVFGLAFQPRPTSDREPPLPLVDSRSCRASYTLTVDLRERAIPVFFDFEGAWSRLAGLSRSAQYPRALAAARRPGPTDGAEEDAATARSISLTLAAAGGDGGASFGESFLASALQRRRLRRCIANGWIARRAFLDATAVGDTIEGLAERVAFVHAQLRPGADGEAVLATLLNEARIAPFLYATDGRSILFAVLAAEAALPPTSNPPRTSAFAVLQASTSEIVTIREPLRTLARVIDFRFDALIDLEEAAGPGSSSA